MKTKPRQKQRSRASATNRAEQHKKALWLYGRHAVLAALNNHNRPLRRVLATNNALEWLREHEAPAKLLSKIKPVQAAEIDRVLPSSSVHQGVAAEVEDLPRANLKDVCANPVPGRPVVILDQVTDPQNIGAIFRTAAAFDARAIIFQDRRTPTLSGALAKAAAGAVETLPAVSVVNIARAIEGLQELGYECIGLAGRATSSIETLRSDRPITIVLGAEGHGLRRLVAQTCDELYQIPIAPTVESLNVSTAAAITLYQATRPSSKETNNG